MANKIAKRLEKLAYKAIKPALPYQLLYRHEQCSLSTDLATDTLSCEPLAMNTH